MDYELAYNLAKALGKDVQWRWWLHWFLRHEPDSPDCGRVRHSISEDEYIAAGDDIKRDSFVRVPCELQGDCWWVVDFTLDDMHEVENEIDRRELQNVYIEALLSECRVTEGLRHYAIVAGWVCAHATAEQKARAALATLTQS